MQTQTTQQTSGGSESSAAARSGGLDALLSRPSLNLDAVDTSGDDDEPLPIDDNAVDADDHPEAATKGKADEAEDPLLKELGVTAAWAKENGAILDKIRARFAPQEPEKKADEPDTNKVLRDLMAELEGKATQEDTPKKQAAEDQHRAAPQERFKFGDIGDDWTSLTDAYRARTEADVAGDHAKIDAIDSAIFARRLFSVMPGITQYVNGLISQAIGKHVPQDILQETGRFREERLDREGRERAEKMLAEKFGDTFAEMLRSDGGKEVVLDGQALDPFPFNRIAAEHPYLLELRREHKDPEKAAILTWVARLGAAYNIHKNNRARANELSQAAKTMADASAKSAARTERERARTTAHAGGRSNGTIDKQPKPEDDREEMRKFIEDNSPGAAIRRLSRL